MGNTAPSGGGIFNSGGKVTLPAGSRLTGNTANSRGGGIYRFDGTVTLDSGAIICNNMPLDNQCDGGFTGTGTCPAPSPTCPS